MVDSCLECETCKHEEEQYCPETVFTYGYRKRTLPQEFHKGLLDNIVVRDHFAVHIPDHISFQEAAPLLCAGITTYSPLMKADLKKGVKVGVAGIGGWSYGNQTCCVQRGGRLRFYDLAGKVKDILAFGAKEAIVVDSSMKLAPYKGKLDYMIATIPVQYDIAAYTSVVKTLWNLYPGRMPEKFEVTLNNLGLSISRVNFNASLIGGMKDTQEVVNYCADNKVHPQIQIIKAEQINEAWENVVNKKARYRYVIDAATF